MRRIRRFRLKTQRLFSSTDWTGPGEPLQKLAEAPAKMGRITEIKVEKGKIFVETESGTPMIVPQPSTTKKAR